MSAGTKRVVNTYDLFVSNLPHDVDQKRIGKVFSKYGEIHNLWINSNTDGGRYCIIKYYCEEDSQKAIDECNGLLFEGLKPIYVKKNVKRSSEGRQGMMPKKETPLTDQNQEKEDTVAKPVSGPAFEMGQNLPPRRDHMMKLLVSHIETPIIIWGQKISIDNANELASLQEQMSILCPDLPKISGKPESDKIYGAQYSEDGLWYRCNIRYTYNQDRVKVQYIDFGNTEELNPSSLVELPKTLSALSPCAIKVVLHSLWCNSNQDPQGLKYLRDMIEGKEIEVNTTARLSDQTGFYAEVSQDGVSVNEKMLESNFVFRKPDQKGMIKGRTMQGGPSGPAGDGGFGGKQNMFPPNGENKCQAVKSIQMQERREAPKPHHNGQNGGNKSGVVMHSNKSGPNYSGQEMHSNKRNIAQGPLVDKRATAVHNAGPNTVPIAKGRTLVSRDVMSSDAVTGIKGGMPGQLGGPRKFDSDKDEINTLRWKLKNLQAEYSSLSNKAQENDMSLQMTRIQNLTSKVRKLRNQFPLDKETPLDRGITLVRSPGKIHTGMAQSLPEVFKAIGTYKTANEEILKCSDNTILNEKIESRDSVRRDLFEKLNITIEELNNVPLPARGKEVQDVVSSLTKNYDGFTKFPLPNPPAIETLVPDFEQWKEKKKGEVIEARKSSDALEKTFSEMLDKLKSVVSLNSELENEEISDEFNETLKRYIRTLQEEISIADTENSPDSGLLASLVQACLKELQEESGCAHHLASVLKDFVGLRDQIQPWLNSSPSSDRLTEVRAKLKALKSGLRHKLADKVDAEENQETEEIEEINQQVESIRGKIQKALKVEDKLLCDMSQLASEHFPELVNSDKDPVFSAHVMYKGLVKLSHAPDHYALTSVGSSSTGMFESQFDEEPVFIKEHFLSNGSHLDKDKFLSQMALYSSAASPHLEPVSAVFFAKNNRHAYVEVKNSGQLLSSVVEQAPPTKEQIQSVVKSLCFALRTLNSYNFVHGQLQPELIVVDEQWNAKLLPPDFSLNDADRCRSRFTTSSSVDIIAPEMKQTKVPASPSHAVDVYCLGLLALWMHHPTVQFKERMDGLIDFAALTLDRYFGLFLMKVMHPSPMMRPTATNCLCSEYLNLPVLNTQQEDGISDSKPLNEAVTGRNSASPASVLSQGSNEGLVYAENGGGMQLIANTRIPPPVSGVMDGQVPSANVNTISQQQQNFQHYQQQQLRQQQQQQYNMQVQQQQLQKQQEQQQQQLHNQQLLEQQHKQQKQFLIQQQLQQQQLQQQQQQQQQQQNETSAHSVPNTMGNDAFEIGTFDPNAYEVVSSPPMSEDMTGQEGKQPDLDQQSNHSCASLKEPTQTQTNSDGREWWAESEEPTESGQ